jgi:hypothetical protein
MRTRPAKYSQSFRTPAHVMNAPAPHHLPRTHPSELTRAPAHANVLKQLSRTHPSNLTRALAHANALKQLLRASLTPDACARTRECAPPPCTRASFKADARACAPPPSPHASLGVDACACTSKRAQPAFTPRPSDLTRAHPSDLARAHCSSHRRARHCCPSPSPPCGHVVDSWRRAGIRGMAACGGTAPWRSHCDSHGHFRPDVPGVGGVGGVQGVQGGR